jgi:hypothetical protein
MYVVIPFLDKPNFGPRGMCPEARLSPSLEASLPQETAGKPYEQNLTQCYRCADLLIQDCLDIESDPFASSDKLQLNSISGARSMSPCEDKRHPGTPVLSTYGNIWDDSDSSDPGVVNMIAVAAMCSGPHTELARKDTVTMQLRHLQPLKCASSAALFRNTSFGSRSKPQYYSTPLRI